MAFTVTLIMSHSAIQDKPMIRICHSNTTSENQLDCVTVIYKRNFKQSTKRWSMIMNYHNHESLIPFTRIRIGSARRSTIILVVRIKPQCYFREYYRIVQYFLCQQDVFDCFDVIAHTLANPHILISSSTGWIASISDAAALPTPPPFRRVASEYSANKSSV